jgi:hypothetical protein
LKPAHDLSGQIVGGRTKPSARENDINTLHGHKVKRSRHIRRTIPNDRHIGQINPKLKQPLGQPRPVTIGNPAGEDLRARDNNPSTSAHSDQPIKRSSLIDSVKQGMDVFLGHKTR